MTHNHSASSAASKSALLIRALELTATVLATIAFSRYLQALTHSALWLPEAFRDSVTFLSVGFSTTAATLAKNFFSLYAEKRVGGSSYSVIAISRGSWFFIGARSLGRLRNPSHIERVRTYWAAGFLVLACILFWEIASLKFHTVWDFSPDPIWVQRNYGDPASNSEHGAKLAARTDKPSDKLPDFINLEDHKIFMPLTFDVPMEAYLRKLGGGQLQAGFQRSLILEPSRLIDWSNEAGTSVRQRYVLYFLLLHFGLISASATAWGLFEEKLEFAVHGLIDLVPNSI